MEQMTAALMELPLKKGQERFKRALTAEPMLFGPPGSPLSQACFYALESGGKRFRPAIVYMVAEARGFGEHGGLDEAAMAVEFFHTASLIADDLPCMDDDDERRGRPSLHKAFGESTALLASYALIAEGYGKLGEGARLAGVPEALLPALENVSKNTGAKGATGGQYLDLFPEDALPETVRKALAMKTGTLFEIAFVLGWLYSGGAAGRLSEVKEASRHFGMAFQIADDLSDSDDDSEAGRTVNLASALGKEHAARALRDEVEAFKLALDSLGLSGKELKPLVESLLN